MSYSMFTLGKIEASAEFSVGGAVDKAIGAVGRGAKKTGQVVWATSKRGVRYARRVGARVGGAVMSGAKTAARHVRAHGGKYAIGAGALAAGAGAAGYLANKNRNEYSSNPYLAEFARLRKQAPASSPAPARKPPGRSANVPDAVTSVRRSPTGSSRTVGGKVDRAINAARRGDSKVGQTIWATSKKGVRYARRVGQRVGGAVMSGAKTAARHVRAHGGKYAIGAGALAAGAGAAGYLANRNRNEYSSNPYLVEFNSKKKSLKRRAIAR